MGIIYSAVILSGCSSNKSSMSHTNSPESNQTESDSIESSADSNQDTWDINLRSSRRSLKQLENGESQIQKFCSEEILVSSENELPKQYKLLDYDEHSIFCSVSSDDSDEIVYQKINRETLQIQSILCEEKFPYLLDEVIIAGRLYLVSASPTDSDLPWLVCVCRIDSSGKSHEIYSVRTTSIPQVWHNESDIFITADTEDFTSLSFVEQLDPLKSLENFKVVARTAHSQNKDGTITGDYILYSGGSNDAIYLEHEQLNGDHPEDQPDVQIVRYQADGLGKSSSFGIKNGLSRYVSGNLDYLFLSLYQDKLEDIQSGDNSGILIDLDSLDIWELPETSAGFEIYHALWPDCQAAVFQNSRNNYLVNLEKKEFLSWENNGNGLFISHGTTIGWFEQTKNSVTFRELNLECLTW